MLVGGFNKLDEGLSKALISPFTTFEKVCHTHNEGLSKAWRRLITSLLELGHKLVNGCHKLEEGMS